MATEEKLPDLLQSNLRIVFCGTAAGHRSAQLGAYYAGRGNTFWSTLHKVGLTPYQLEPENFRKVRDLGLGLTDLAKKKAGMDHVLKEDDFDRDGLTDKIKSASPRILAFTSKNGAKQFLQKRQVRYGPQGHIDKTGLWVLPSTSGAARKHWDLTWWEKLAAEVQPRH